MEKKMIFKGLSYELKDIDEAKGIVTMYINAFNNEDSDGDISAPGSFKRTFKNTTRIKHLLNHDIYKLIGVPIELYEDKIGAVAVSQLNMKKQLSKDVFEDYRLYAEHGKTLEHSVRVQAVKRNFDDERIVEEWKLWEYSTLYGWGANSETPLIDIKSVDDLEMMMSQGQYSDEKHRVIEELYEEMKKYQQIKTLIDPPGTPEDPPTLDEKFYKQLKL